MTGCGIPSEMLDKIRKLYALSRDPSNEHEAALAADKVRELLTRHKLTIEAVTAGKASAAAERIVCGPRVAKHLTILANACNLLFDVGWFKDSSRELRPTRFIVFCGIPQNVQAAVLTLDYFRESIRALTIRRRREIRRRKQRNRYREGAAARVFASAKELKDAAVAASNDTAALVHVGSAVARRHMDSLNLRHTKLRLARPSKAYILGWLDGSQHRSAPREPATSGGELSDIIKTWPGFMEPTTVRRVFSHKWARFYFSLGRGRPQQPVDRIWLTHRGRAMNAEYQCPICATFKARFACEIVIHIQEQHGYTNHAAWLAMVAQVEARHAAK